MLRTFVFHAAAPLRTSIKSSTRRCLSTLQSNPKVHILRNPVNARSYIISLLPDDPPIPELALGETDSNPPEENPRGFTQNEGFFRILNSVLAEHAHTDPQVKSQAAALASTSGATLMQVNRRTNTGSAGAFAQGGAGSGGKGGYIHVSDNRHPPDYGRIAEPEDIFGSVEVDSDGSFTDGHGKYQPSGTYRMVTRDGVLGLPDHLMSKLIERLKIEEAAIKNK